MSIHMNGQRLDWSPTGETSLCVVVGCRNPVVRVFKHKADAAMNFGVCALHGQTVIKYGTDEQVSRYVFPSVEAGEGETT